MTKNPVLVSGGDAVLESISQLELLELLEPHMITPWRAKLHDPTTVSNVREGMCRFTPDLCQKLLATRNPRNRNINQRKVAKLRNAMRENRWNSALPDSTVVFGADGNIKNCQHRFRACVDEGIPFVSRIEIGHENEILVYLDQTEPRTENQQARILGRDFNEKYDYPSVKFLWQLQHQKTYFPFERGSKTFDLIDHAYPKEIWSIVPVKAGDVRLIYPIRSTLLLLAIYWPKEIKEFVEQIHNVCFPVKHSGPWLLYNYMTNNSKLFQTEKQTYEGKMAMVRRTFKAFHLHLEGKTVTKLRDSSDSVYALLRRIDPEWNPLPDGPFDRSKAKSQTPDVQDDDDGDADVE